MISRLLLLLLGAACAARQAADHNVQQRVCRVGARREHVPQALKVGLRLAGRPIKRCAPPPAQQQQVVEVAVKDLVGRLVQHGRDRDARPRHSLQRRHERLTRCRVEAAGGLIQQQQRWVCNQLHPNVHAAPLPATAREALW